MLWAHLSLLPSCLQRIQTLKRKQIPQRTPSDGSPGETSPKLPISTPGNSTLSPTREKRALILLVVLGACSPCPMDWTAKSARSQGDNPSFPHRPWLGTMPAESHRPENTSAIYPGKQITTYMFWAKSNHMATMRMREDKTRACESRRKWHTR